MSSRSCRVSRSMCGLPHSITRSFSTENGATSRSAKSFLVSIRSVIRPRLGEFLARDRRVIHQLFLDQFAQMLVLRQVLGDEILVREFIDETAGVREHDLVETIVDIGILDDRHERGETRARGQQPQRLARQQVVRDQRTRRLLADQHGVAHFQMLQARGERTVLDLDAQETPGALRNWRSRGCMRAAAVCCPTSSPTMVNWPFWKRNEESRVQVKLNKVSVQ